jgi:hypothetical protein
VGLKRQGVRVKSIEGVATLLLIETEPSSFPYASGDNFTNTPTPTPSPP